ncbi:MAG: monofunctional biosynthetic peptidoglycan transglycosylase [Albidovulum sp.]
MATGRKTSAGTTRKRTAAVRRGGFRQLPFTHLWRWFRRGVMAVAVFFPALILLYAFVNPPTNYYILSESYRLGGVARDWVDLEDMAPDMARSVVAAEDANFCLHWGFDIKAIKAALEEGANRGASTVTQQVVKNVFLWQGRSWLRKAMEAVLTPVVELVWTKRRIVEVYLNVAETGKGVFGVEAAAQTYFGTSAAKLSAKQAALIAAALPDPKGRNPAKPSGYLRKRAAAIIQGAETIKADGRAACFED